MNIKLEEFVRTEQAIIPVVDHWAQFKGRKTFGLQGEDNWYLAEIGNKVKLLRAATPLEVLKTLTKYRSLRFYALGQEGVPVNFENLMRRGLAETVNINFLNLPAFEIAKAVQWEDKRFYFYDTDNTHRRSTLTVLKRAFEQETPISNVRDLTPELHYYWLLLNLQRQSYRESQRLFQLKLSTAERDKRIKEFQNSFAGRLQSIITAAGGKLVKFIRSNRDTYLVHWQTPSGQTVKSTIHDDMRILSLGFCASGADKQHTMASAVQLAKMFEQSAPLYITRE